MTVQQIVTQTATDMRQLLSDQEPDAGIIIPWVDRIHKDALHSSIWSYLLRLTVSVPTFVGQSLYNVAVPSGSIMRRILSVYDRTFDRVLIPYGKLAEGLGLDKGTPESMISAETMIQWPEYYLREGVNSLWIFPAPQKAAFTGLFEVHFELGAPNLVNLTDTLLIPDDGIDLIVAGVNSLTASYLKNADESQRWAAMYEKMKMNGQGN